MTRAEPTSSGNLLAIYLDDHRAGAAAGAALARRVQDRYGAEPGFEALNALKQDIDADVRTLDALRDRLGVHGGGLKRAIALIGERLGRLKLNGRIVRRSPLSKLLELEMLTAGVAAKERLWAGLMAACDTEQLADVDLHEQRARADDQLDRLRALHRRAAASIGCPPPDVS